MGSLGEKGLGGWVGFGGGVGDHLDDLPEGKAQTVALVFAEMGRQISAQQVLTYIGKGRD